MGMLTAYRVLPLIFGTVSLSLAASKAIVHLRTLNGSPGSILVRVLVRDQSMYYFM